MFHLRGIKPVLTLCKVFEYHDQDYPIAAELLNSWNDKKVSSAIWKLFKWGCQNIEKRSVTCSVTILWKFRQISLCGIYLPVQK